MQSFLLIIPQKIRIYKQTCPLIVPLPHPSFTSFHYAQHAKSCIPSRLFFVDKSMTSIRTAQRRICRVVLLILHTLKQRMLEHIT